MENVIRGILGKRKRRIPILYRWNARQPPIQKKSLEEIFERFIAVIMYEPLDICMTHAALYPFGHVYSSLAIPYEWMTHYERRQMVQIYHDRASHFKKESKHGALSNQFMLSEVIGQQPTLSIEHRRELFRDFIGMCHVQKDPFKRELVRYALLAAIQQLMHTGPPPDAFFSLVQRYLNGMCDFGSLIVYDIS